MITLLLVALAVHAAPPAALPVGAPAEPSSADAAPVDPQWAVATSRMLGAAGTVRDRAWRLRQTGEAAAAAGQVQGLSALSSDARELNQAVSSAVLAAEVLAEQGPTAAP